MPTSPTGRGKPAEPHGSHGLVRDLRRLVWLIATLHRYDAVMIPFGHPNRRFLAMAARWAGRDVFPSGRDTEAGTHAAVGFAAGQAGIRPASRTGWATPAEPSREAAEGPGPASGGESTGRVARRLTLRTGSVADRRDHSWYDVPASMPPRLLTMIDAEEAFDWSRPFDRDATDVSSMGAQHLAHRIFERHGVVPLYLVDYPVVAQEAGWAELRDLARSGLCDIGAQMHPWVTPPFDETVSEFNSYAGNLPFELELEKTRRLTDALGNRFGEAPRIYRTGRFGAGPNTLEILKRLGYTADTSVTPCWPAAGIVGSWVGSARPFWVDRERTLLELPVSAGLVGRLAETPLARLAPAAFSGAANRLMVAGALSHLGLLERIRLSPEGMTIEEAKRLVRHMLATGHRIFVMTYHSPSLVPGNTPYVRDDAQLARFLAWLDEFYAFFQEEIGGRPATWREVRHPSESHFAGPTA